MTCSYCGTRNAVGEHRCTRCGRQPQNTMGGTYAVNGALAEQLKPAPRMRLVERQPDISEREQTDLSQAIQGTLFQASNESPIPPRLEPKPRVRPGGPAKPATSRTATR